MTTTERLVNIAEYRGFGSPIIPLETKAKVPSMVIRTPEELTMRLPNVNPETLLIRRSGVVDPSPIEMHVSEDANIRAVIRTGEPVRFKGLDIGPAGSSLGRVA